MILQGYNDSDCDLKNGLILLKIRNKYVVIKGCIAEDASK